MIALLGRLGQLSIENIAGMGKMFNFLLSSIMLSFRRPAKLNLIIYHIKTISVDSLSVVALSGFFTGMVMGNVLALGTFGVGDVMKTKPYVSGAAYIDRMSDYCRGCQFDPKTSCPVTPMYWAFLARHEQALAGNPRMAMPLRSLARRSTAQRARDAATFDSVSSTLAAGRPLAPLPGA